MKVVLDTSVLIAAFYQPLHRPCFSRDVYDYLVDNESVHVSPYILRESRNKCVAKLKLAPRQVQHLESLIRARVHVEKAGPPRWIRPEKLSARDVKDLPIVELAVSISADLLLSWDKDLRDLKKVGATLILSPSEFWTRLNEL